jgi:fatty-acyl-CoA synthase
MSTNPMCPRYATPADLDVIEQLPLAVRGLPTSTYAAMARAASVWPDQIALTVLPDEERWRRPIQRTFSQLLRDTHRTANLLRDMGVERESTIALIAPNCDELITATLGAQLAGIAATTGGATGAPKLAAHTHANEVIDAWMIAANALTYQITER